MEPESLWVKVVKSIHHNQRKSDFIPTKKSLPGVWKNIGSIDKEFRKCNIEVSNKLISKVGMGDKTLFWTDSWIGIGSLKSQFPALFQLAGRKKTLLKDCYRQINGGYIWDWSWVRTPSSDIEKQEMENLIGLLQDIQLTGNSDVWYSKDSEQKDFTVKDVRKSLSSALDLNMTADDFDWNSWATSKSIMFVWRAIQDKIPSAVALRHRGVNIPDVTCKICGAAEETTDHILVSCNYATRIWEMITNWVKIPKVNSDGNVKDVLKEMNEIHRNGKIKKVIHAITIQTMWSLWRARNDKKASENCGVFGIWWAAEEREQRRLEKLWLLVMWSIRDLVRVDRAWAAEEREQRLAVGVVAVVVVSGDGWSEWWV
ncbi:uncharacterized protein LOC110892697 [Helianthus annuus]|uniref:uncharacterized protein LOC110892697 n=1 Tax=Helianthus annuus TaxID=4232 RepID=UPI000B8FA777|nr:uncharacterized protein LOC110892697 [Helianthus annuus]